MVARKASTCGVLLLALLMRSPAPLTAQYVIHREPSTFVEESKAALTVPAVPAAPAATAAVSRSAVASAEATPNATLAPTPIPTVPKPVTVVNIQASNDTSSNDTALYSVLRIIGTGVTPFNLDRQKILLTALGYVISTVDLSNMYITDVNPVYASRRRQLLMEADNQQEMVLGHRRALLAASAYDNQADVTVMMIEDSSSTIPDTMTELNTSIANSTLLTELQALGESTWVVQLMNSTTATAFSINATKKDTCHDKFGHWCLDSHKHLSSAGVRGIIAGGIIGIICVVALAMILKDLHGARALKGNEVVYNPQTPNLGGAPGTGKSGAGVVAGAAGATALRAHAGTPTGHSPTVGYTGGLAPVGQNVGRKSGAFTSGAVTHPASLAAAGKPTGLEEMVNSPSFSRGNTPAQSPTLAANQRHS